jgi:fatty-acyl-CoA synthase
MPTDPIAITRRLETAAESSRGIVFLCGPEPERVPFGQLYEEARSVAATLQQRGVGPGDHVAILGPTSRALVTTIEACWMAGITSMVLPLPMRLGSLEEFVQGTRARMIHGDACLLLMDDALASLYEPAPGDPPIESLAAVQPGRGAPGAAFVPPPDDPDRLVILQYTSGSTSEPKGVMLPDRVLGANLDAIRFAAGLVPDDVLVSWLPLYHDMGLVGKLASSLTNGAEFVLAAPQDFLAKPGRWMQWISTYRGTVTAGPNFSWVLAARALAHDEGLDLSSLRLALNGAEPVDPDTVEAFVRAAKPHRFDPGAVFCAFGMAEVGIGGTFPPLGRGMVCDPVDRFVLEREGIAKPADPGDELARRLPLLGRPVPGLTIRVCDPVTGEALPDRHVGELEINGTSVTTGYYKRPDVTAASFHDGWLRTGDLGYLLDGELVLCGRIKDVIIIGGRNVFPEDIERAVGDLEGVRAGNVIAFGVEGYKARESVVVVAEVRGTEIEPVRKAVHRKVLEVTGVPPRDVMLVEPGSLPKTSSGKLQRGVCRERYLNEDLRLVPT